MPPSPPSPDPNPPTVPVDVRALPSRTPSRVGSLLEAFWETSGRDPHAIAWLGSNSREPRPSWTWSEFRIAVERAAAYLASLGVQPGDRIANLGRNAAPWAILDLACAWVGAIHAPIDARYPPHWIERCLLDLQAKLVFADDCHRAAHHLPLSTLGESRSRATRPQATLEDRLPHADDTACILFTSGTTRHPKGVMLSHRNLLFNALAKLDAMPQSSADMRLNLLPFCHAYARTCELSAWIIAGGTMACAHGIDAALERAPRLGPQLINAVPAFYEELQRRAGRASPTEATIIEQLGGRVRRLASGGAPLADSTRNAFAQAGLPIFQGYGLTEASPVVCSNRDTTEQGEPLLGGVGTPVAGVRIRIDADQRIWVAGEGVMQGYWRDPAATASRVIGGWLDTGDLAAPRGASDLGALHVEGRRDDVQVLANGCKFSPRPLEQRLVAAIDAIEHCVLLGTGRRQPLLAVQLTRGSEDVRASDILGQARELLCDANAVSVPNEVWIAPEPWTVANGCLHWKGPPDRAAIRCKIEAAQPS